MGPSTKLFVDLGTKTDLPSTSEIFKKLRPDIAIVNAGVIVTGELTVCHETNMSNSKEFKDKKYSSLEDDLLPAFRSFQLKKYTIEVSSLGFISETSKFTEKAVNKILPVEIASSLTRVVISSSFSIYKNRNSDSTTV